MEEGVVGNVWHAGRLPWTLGWFRAIQGGKMMFRDALIAGVANLASPFLWAAGLLVCVVTAIVWRFVHDPEMAREAQGDFGNPLTRGLRDHAIGSTSVILAFSFFLLGDRKEVEFGFGEWVWALFFAGFCAIFFAFIPVIGGILDRRGGLPVLAGVIGCHVIVKGHASAPPEHVLSIIGFILIAFGVQELVRMLFGLIVYREQPNPEEWPLFPRLLAARLIPSMAQVLPSVLYLELLQLGPQS